MCKRGVERGRVVDLRTSIRFVESAHCTFMNTQLCVRVYELYNCGEGWPLGPRMERIVNGGANKQQQQCQQ